MQISTLCPALLCSDLFLGTVLRCCSSKTRYSTFHLKPTCILEYMGEALNDTFIKSTTNLSEVK